MSMLLRRRIMLLGGAIVKTVRGAIVHITDALAKPLKKCEVTLEPIQDLHGHDNPYPAGGGKNLIPDGTDTSNGYINNAMLLHSGSTNTSSTCYVSEYFPITEGSTYTWSENTSGFANIVSICFYDSEKVYISGIAGGQSLPKTFSAPQNAAYCRATQAIDFAAKGFQIELGSTATTIEPYSNICPITGHTGVNVVRAGKNLLPNDLTWTDGARDDNGEQTTSNVAHYSNTFLVEPLTQYTVSGLSDSSHGLRLYYLTSSGEWIKRTSMVLATSYTFTTPSNCRLMQIQTRKDLTITEPQIELGSTATDYEAYSGTTYSVTFPASGKNLGNFVDGYNVDSSGKVSENAARSATVEPIYIDSETSYIFTCDNSCLGIYSVWNDDTLVRRVATVASGTTLDTSGGNKMYVCIYKADYTTAVETDHPMIRKSTESATYEPFENTFYGGTLDVVSGELVVDSRYFVADGTNIKCDGIYGEAGANTLPDIDISANPSVKNNNKLKSSYLKTVTSASSQNSIGYGNQGNVIAIHIGTIQGVDGTYGYSSSAELLAAANTYLQEHPLSICYELATPIEYDLTPQQITALLGENNIWSNGSEVEVTYRASAS